MSELRVVATQHLSPKGSTVAFLAVFCSTGFWLIAPWTAYSQNEVQRDQKALAILTQTIAAGGGPQILTSTKDITENAKITYDLSSSNDSASDVIVKGRGLHQFKMEAYLPTGKRTTIVNGYGGSLREANGKSVPISRQSAKDLGGLTIPYLSLVADTQNSSISIVYEGLVTHNGSLAHDIRFQRVYTPQEDPLGDRGKQEARDVYIDPQTLFITAIVDEIHFSYGPHDKGISHEILYSNYLAKGGLVLPMTIVEKSHGVTRVTITVSEVTTNSGLSNSDFVW